MHNIYVEISIQLAWGNGIVWNCARKWILTDVRFDILATIGTMLLTPARELGPIIPR